MKSCTSSGKSVLTESPSSFASLAERGVLCIISPADQFFDNLFKPVFFSVRLNLTFKELFCNVSCEPEGFSRYIAHNKSRIISVFFFSFCGMDPGRRRKDSPPYGISNLGGLLAYDGIFIHYYFVCCKGNNRTP